MSRYSKVLWLLTALALLALSACGTASPPTQDPAALYTQLAATVLANLTATAAAASPTPALSDTPLASPTLPATNTPLLSSTPLSGTPFVTPDTFTTPTNTPLLSPTPGPGTPSATAITLATLRPPSQTACDNFTFSDVNYPDGTVVTGGANIVKTWEFTNSGPCTWNENYRLIYGWETPDAGWEETQPVTFNRTVNVGESIRLSVPLHVSTKVGGYAAWFRLQNDKGYNFGPVFAVSVIVK
jgi:hypothetical protein